MASKSKERAKTNLFTIQQNMAALDEILLDLGGDVTDEQVAEAVFSWLNENEEQLKDKLDAYAAYLLDLEFQEDGKRLLAQMYTDQARALVRKRDVLKGRIMAFMASRDVTKIEANFNTFAIQANGAAAPLVLGEYDIDYLPEKFVTTTKQVDVDAVRAAIEAGEEISFAHIGPRGVHLRIR
jgi:hypothetical protein